jgi:hypothetical protein
MTQTRHIGSSDTPLDWGGSWLWMLLFGIATGTGAGRPLAGGFAS